MADPQDALTLAARNAALAGSTGALHEAIGRLKGQIDTKDELISTLQAKLDESRAQVKRLELLAEIPEIAIVLCDIAEAHDITGDPRTWREMDDPAWGDAVCELIAARTEANTFESPGPETERKS